MAGSDLKQAAEKMAKRKELLRTSVAMRADAPGNIKLSKAEFIALRRAEKEEELAVAEFKAKRKESNDGVQKGKEGKEAEVKKVGRPKRVE